MWGLLGLLGTMGSGIANWFGNKDANNQNQQQFESNQAWNTMELETSRQYNTAMANTAHQREVADLKAAGINPMMTAMGGSGAPAPTSPVTNAGTGNAIQPNNAIGNAVGAAVSSALGAARTVADIKNTDKDTLLKEASALATAAQAQASTASARQLEEQTRQLARGRDAAAAEADARKNKAALDQTYQSTERVLGVIKQGTGIANDASSAISNFLPSGILKKLFQNRSIDPTKTPPRWNPDMDLERAGSMGVPVP